MSVAQPTILGILNITADSFSDGGKFVEPAAAIAHAEHLIADGAHCIDIGAASSKPNALPVASADEIARLEPVIAALKRAGASISVDSFAPTVQQFALAQSVDYLNDVRGFPDEALYPELAAATAKLIAMHSVTGRGPAMAIEIDPAEVLDRIERYFDTRFGALIRAGIRQDRLILDPGMGFFLGNRREASIRVLRNIEALKKRFGVPVLISVSRKSFLRKIADAPLERAGPPSAAAELFAVLQGADYIRTHDPGALQSTLRVWRALSST